MGDDDLFSSKGGDDDFFSEPKFGEEGGDSVGGDIASDFGGGESLPELDTPAEASDGGKKKKKLDLKLNFNMDRKTILLLVLLVLAGGAGAVYTFFPELIEDYLPGEEIEETQVAVSVPPKPAQAPAPAKPASPAPAPPQPTAVAPVPAPQQPTAAAPAPAKPATPAPALPQPTAAAPAPAKPAIPAPAPPQPTAAAPAPAKPATPAPVPPQPTAAAPAPAKPATPAPAPPQPTAAAPAPAPQQPTAPAEPVVTPTAADIQILKAKLPVKGEKGYFVQSGAFLFKENMRAPKKKIESLGYKPRVEIGRKTVKMNRLLVGDWGDFLVAEATEKALKKDGYSAALISKNERFSVLIGSYYFEKTAKQKKQALIKKGYKARIQNAPINMKIHHLLLGPYSNPDEAVGVADTLNRSGVKSVVLQSQ